MRFVCWHVGRRLCDVFEARLGPEGSPIVISAKPFVKWNHGCAIVDIEFGVVQIVHQRAPQWLVVPIMPTNGRDPRVGEDEEDVEDVHVARKEVRQEACRKEYDVFKRVHRETAPRARIHSLMVERVDVFVEPAVGLVHVQRPVSEIKMRFDPVGDQQHDADIAHGVGAKKVCLRLWLICVVSVQVQLARVTQVQ